MPENRTEGAPVAAPRLLDRLRNAIRARHYSPRTAEAYVFWTRKFILFHGKRHPDTMGAAEVKAFLLPRDLALLDGEVRQAKFTTLTTRKSKPESIRFANRGGSLGRHAA